ncbi:MAG: hypothetical protein ACR2NU_14240 [Aeoliella sp.]
MNMRIPVLSVFLALSCSAVHGDENVVESIAERLVLFVDDHDVLYRPGTKRVLNAVKRHAANPVIPDDQPWEKTIGYTSVHRDPASGKYQLWYQAYSSSDVRMCYATSDDGIAWTRPKLGLFDYKGSKENNIVLTDLQYGASVVHDPDDPDPERRYKTAYFKRGMAVAFSPDGIHWNVHPKKAFDRYSGGERGQPPFVDELPTYFPLTISDVIDVSRDPVRNVWMCYAKTWIDGPDGQKVWRRGVVRTDSVDFVNWSPPRLVVPPDELDEIASLKRGAAKEGETAGGGTQGTHVHGGPTFFYNGIYFSLLQIIDSRHTGLMPIELAISRDGYEFERPFRENWFIPVDGGTSFDSGAIWSNATPVFLEDEIRFYYGAYRGNWKKGLITKPTGVGLATIPRDRFAGIRAIEDVGQITLKPLTIEPGSSIEVNAAAREGSVRIEVLDEYGYRLKGFTKADAAPLESDALRHVATWKENKTSDLPGGVCSLRVHLTGDATVYALNIRPATN